MIRKNECQASVLVLMETYLTTFSLLNCVYLLCISISVNTFDVNSNYIEF